MIPEEFTTPDLVEVVTGLFEAFDRGDWDAGLSLYAPDVTWESEDGLISVSSASRLRGVWEEFTGVFDDHTIQVETVVHLGNGVVYVVYIQGGRLPGGAGVVTSREALVMEWADGLVVRVAAYLDIDEARAAAERLAEEKG